MANRYANLVGSNKIKDEYQKINIGFDKVEQEMDEKPDNSFAKINDVEAEGEDAVTIEAGTGITVTTTPEEKKIRITATGEAAPGPHGSEHNHDGSDPIPDLVQLRDSYLLHSSNSLIHRPIYVSEDDPNNFVGEDGSIYLQLYKAGEPQLVYEEGTWTPVLSAGTAPSGVEYVAQEGHYVRIGNLLTVSIYIEINNKGTGGSGSTVIQGLPYPPRISQVAAIGEVRGVDMTNYDGFSGILVSATSGTMQIRAYAKGDVTNPGGVNYNYVQDNFRIYSVFSYLI